MSAGCSIGGSVNSGRFGIGFAFNFERVACRGGLNGSDVAFLLAIDVGRFALAFRAEFRGDLVTFARHALDNFFRHRRAVFAPLEAFIEQLDPEAFDFLASTLR